MSAVQRDYYELLGIPRDASHQAIKRAYVDIARVYHPDSNYYDEILEYTPNVDQVEVFKLLTQAYQTLCDVQRRAEYDQTLPPKLRSWNEPLDQPVDLNECVEEINYDALIEDIERRRRVVQPKRDKNWSEFGKLEGAEAEELTRSPRRERKDTQSISDLMKVEAQKQVRKTLAVGVGAFAAFAVVVGAVLIFIG